jgi:salicylate hydroxylase
LTLRIGVVGGGIGGLAAAGFLAKSGFDVVVYEQAPALKEVGAGVVVSPNAVRLLRRIGALPHFLRSAVEIERGWEFRRWSDGSVLSSEDMSRCVDLYGERSYFCHRADLLESILRCVPDRAIQLGARCVEVATASDGARLRLADGRQVDVDLLIGADGVHSVVRSAVARPEPATYSGLCAFRALVPIAEAPEFACQPVHTLWLGPDHHLVHYPVSSGQLVNIVAFAPAGDFRAESWSTVATVAELAAEFDGWDPRLRTLIAHSRDPGRWALLDRPPLKTWSRGRIVLLGDAAHPMFPFYAQGAAQAIEDAAALAVCLAENRDDPGRALDIYQELRMPRAGKIQTLSHARKDINHLPDGPEQIERDAELAGADALVRSGWIYGHDAEAAAREACAAERKRQP